MPLVDGLLGLLAMPGPDPPLLVPLVTSVADLLDKGPLPASFLVERVVPALAGLTKRVFVDTGAAGDGVPALVAGLQRAMASLAADPVAEGALRKEVTRLLLLDAFQEPPPSAPAVQAPLLELLIRLNLRRCQQPALLLAPGKGQALVPGLVDDLGFWDDLRAEVPRRLEALVTAAAAEASKFHKPRAAAAGEELEFTAESISVSSSSPVHVATNAFADSPAFWETHGGGPPHWIQLRIPGRNSWSRVLYNATHHQSYSPSRVRVDLVDSATGQVGFGFPDVQLPDLAREGIAIADAADLPVHARGDALRITILSNHSSGANSRVTRIKVLGAAQPVEVSSTQSVPLMPPDAAACRDEIRRLMGSAPPRLVERLLAALPASPSAQAAGYSAASFLIACAEVVACRSAGPSEAPALEPPVVRVQRNSSGDAIAPEPDRKSVV